MRVISINEAQADLTGLIAETVMSHEPIQIAGASQQAVLVAESDWRAIQESLYLLSIPGMRESIRDGMATPIAECSETLEW